MTVKSIPILMIFLTGIVVIASAQNTRKPFEQLVPEFDYDREAPHGMREVGREIRDGITIIDFTYASPRGGNVPSYLILPAGKGPFAAILFGHWMMPGSPMTSRLQFLDEALVLARAGAASLLIDAPHVRGGFAKEKDELRGAIQSAEVARQQVIDFRRGLDLLLARPDINPKRIAYVGHSFDAHVGGILAGVEKRIGSFVLMAGGFADEAYVFDEENPEMVKLRARVGDERLRDYFRTYAWDDPANFIGHSAPAAVFLQFGRQDKPISAKTAKRAYQLFSEPKTMKFYEAGHALNAEARRERADWLAKRLSLRQVDHAALASIPELK